MLICGIDEAGRGPVIGPMAICSVILEESGAKELKDMGVRDSKKLSPAKRESMEPRIKELAIEWKLALVLPAEIDLLRKRMSLNQIEAEKMAYLIGSHSRRPEKVIVDAADSVAENFGERIRVILRSNGSHIPQIVSEHKADDRYIEVSAASVIAKVARDRAIEEIRIEYGEIGSGYPSDEVTMEYVRKAARAGDLPHFVRRSWISAKRSNQTSLGEF
ncbi:MAG: ribonuclease HII [Candidatus Altiarchaeia archaeon]